MEMGTDFDTRAPRVRAHFWMRGLTRMVIVLNLFGAMAVAGGHVGAAAPIVLPPDGQVIATCDCNTPDDRASATADDSNDAATNEAGDESGTYILVATIVTGPDDAMDTSDDATAATASGAMPDDTGDGADDGTDDATDDTLIVPDAGN